MRDTRANPNPDMSVADKVARAHVIRHQVSDLLRELNQLAAPYGELPYVFPLGEDAADYIEAISTTASFIGYLIPKEVN